MARTWDDLHRIQAGLSPGVKFSMNRRPLQVLWFGWSQFPFPKALERRASPGLPRHCTGRGPVLMRGRSEEGGVSAWQERHLNGDSDGSTCCILPAPESSPRYGLTPGFGVRALIWS